MWLPAPIRRFLGSNKYREIAPDEIFIDAHNLPQFDEHQFEGRMERPLSKRTVLYFGFFVFLVGAVFLSRVFFLQVIEGEVYAAQSENNRLNHSLVFANRGVIYDRTGAALAWNADNEEHDFPSRLYHESHGLSHVLGYIGYPQVDASGFYYQEEFVGKTGIEREFNSTIVGSNGLKIVETDALQNIVSESVVRPPREGEDISLAVDHRVSNKLYELMRKRAEEANFEGGVGLIMDVWTGELIALSNFPEYDPNNLAAGGTEEIQAYLSDVRKPFLNRAVSGLYAPGSIIKPFIALAALEEHIIHPETEILSTGSLVLPNPYFPDKPSVFRDWKAHGLVDMREALAVSSDVYFYEVGGGYEDQEGLGIERIEEYLRLFGFGEETALELSTEAVGTIPNPEWKKEQFEGEAWNVGNTYHTAIGQYGLQVTPIQALRAVAALANNGQLVTPRLSKNAPSKHRALPIAKQNLDIVREGMRKAVTDGTASGLDLSYLTVAAKTGTAELGSSKSFVNSWVTGFFPYENPRYAFLVLMERGPEENVVGALFVMRQLFDWMHEQSLSYVQ